MDSVLLTDAVDKNVQGPMHDPEVETPYIINFNIKYMCQEFCLAQ